MFFFVIVFWNDFFLSCLIELKFFVVLRIFLYVKNCVLLDSKFFKFVEEILLFEEVLDVLEYLDFLDRDWLIV